MHAPDTKSAADLGKQRVEALSDGIFAVAMTLLVIELKLPDHAAITTQAQLINATAQLLPRFIAWVISFLVLALFWVSHHRQFHYVQQVSARLTWVNMALLAFVALMPFSSAMVGEYGGAFFAQCVYALNMAALAVVSLWSSRIIYVEAQGTAGGLPRALYRSTQLRSICLLALCGLDMAVAWFAPPFATLAFALMWPVGALARRIEVHERTPAAAPRPSNTKRK